MRVIDVEVNAGLPASAPRKWFIWHDGPRGNAEEIMVSLEALLADNADVEDLCEWARAAKVGDKYELGGAAPPGLIVCESAP